MKMYRVMKNVLGFGTSVMADRIKDPEEATKLAEDYTKVALKTPLRDRPAYFPQEYEESRT